MDSREFSEWIAYNSVHPIGDDREDMRWAIACASAVNVWATKGHEVKAEKYLDALPGFNNKPPQTAGEMALCFPGMGEAMAKQRAAHGDNH